MPLYHFPCVSFNCYVLRSALKCLRNLEKFEKLHHFACIKREENSSKPFHFLSKLLPLRALLFNITVTCSSYWDLNRCYSYNLLYEVLASICVRHLLLDLIFSSYVFHLKDFTETFWVERLFDQLFLTWDIFPSQVQH